MGKKDRKMISIIIKSQEIELGDIKEEYEKKYEKGLERRIEEDCYGELKRMLVEMMG